MLFFPIYASTYLLETLKDMCVSAKYILANLLCNYITSVEYILITYKRVNSLRNCSVNYLAGAFN